MKYIKKKLVKTIGTQTDLDSRLLIPRVVIQRIETNVNPSVSSTSIILNSPITTQKGKKIGRAPYNYKQFVKPITNNEIANSTFTSIGEWETHPESSFPVPLQMEKLDRPSKKVRFKPGPQCYKNRLLKQQELLDIDDMNVPIMLNMPVQPSNGMPEYLETIAEGIDEASQTTPNPELNLNIDSIEIAEISILDPSTIEQFSGMRGNVDTKDQTHGAPDMNITIERATVIQNECSPEDTRFTRKRGMAVQTEHKSPLRPEKSAKQPEKAESTSRYAHTENTNIHIEGITTIVSQENCNSQDEETSGSAEENEQRHGQKRPTETNAEYIKIVAKNVYINNHFYKS